MGLAGQRNRRKLDLDPNNTRWTRDETTFGQKILRAQGWEPGKVLGAEGASHAEFHSAASLAPIKVNLKDDTLGLGAKIRQKQSDECTGLDVFKDLLGRLNGKSDTTLEKERQVRSEIKTNLYVERKYGPMRFVSGGLLVGDQSKMAELASSASKPANESITETTDYAPPEKQKKEKKSKKRKADESEDMMVNEKKHEKKRKRGSVDSPSHDITEAEAAATKKSKREKSKKSKKSKDVTEDQEKLSSDPDKRRKKSKRSKDASENQASAEDSPLGSEDESLKKHKKDKKEKKKDKKRKQAEAEQSAAADTTTKSTLRESESPTPVSTGTSTPHALSARHRSRARHIASKKMAYSDLSAMNQIFMVKPV